MDHVVRSPAWGLSCGVALSILALSLCSCAPKFNDSGSVSGTGTYTTTSDPDEVLITSPDQDGTKISYLAENSVTVSGICNEPGWKVVVSGDASGTTTCQIGDTWSLSLDFSEAADGTVSISAQQSNGSQESELVTRSFMKDTAFCAANSGNTPYAGGSGSSGSPYLICSTAQLVHLSNTSADWGNNFELRNDIDLSAQTWTPVDLCCSTFDGDGFKILNLSVSLPGTSSVALFASAKTIENLGVINASVSGANYVAILCGQGCGTVTNCYTTGSVIGSGFHVGGLMGQGTPTMSNSWSSATITASAQGNGGLIGHNYGGSISDSYFTGSVTGPNWVGGVAGVNDTGSTITNSYSTGAVISTGGIAGGLVGLNNASIVTSFATGAVTGTGTLGGLDGSSTGTATDSYWDITTASQSTSGDGMGLTDSEMQAQANFTGFDFTTPAWVWKSYLSSYPVLEWQ